MIKTIFAAFIAIMAFTAPGLAADNFAVKAPATFNERHSFSGAYVGLNIGGGSLDTDTTNQSITTTGGLVGIPNGSFPSTTFGGADASANMKGLIIGTQAGYSQEFGPVLLGVEGSFNGTSFRETNEFCGSAMGPCYKTSTRLDWFSTIHARAGIVVNKLLVYGLGGFAVGNVTSSLDITPGPLGAPTAAPFNGKISRTLTGYTVGGGAEWAFTGNWHLRAEYKYLDLGSANAEFDFGANGRANATANFKAHTGVIGVNYRF